MSKKQSNSFAAAAISLAITPEELKKRLDAHIHLKTLEVERDRAINVAHSEYGRLVRLAANVISVLEPLEGEGKKISITKAKMLLKYAQNIVFDKKEATI